MFITILVYLLTVVEILSSLLLIGAILLQKPRGQGGGLAFGAGMGESLFGSQAGNVLTRSTVVLAVIFLVNTTLLALLGSGGHGRVSVAERVRLPVSPVRTAPEIPHGMPAGPVPEAPSDSVAPARTSGGFDQPSVQTPPEGPQSPDMPGVDQSAAALSPPAAPPIQVAPTEPSATAHE